MRNTDHIIYFDGVCNLCHWAVKFIVVRDKRSFFSFASLQSSFAQNHLTYPNGQGVNYNSVVYQHGEKIYTKSKAALKILNELGGIWKLASIFSLMPTALLDHLYDFIASHRYSWFGKKDQCFVPSPEIRARFLD
jgi:predicted DCC family thiol-disulfide oxidoreductase YuxK